MPSISYVLSEILQWKVLNPKPHSSLPGAVSWGGDQQLFNDNQGRTAL